MTVERADVPGVLLTCTRCHDPVNVITVGGPDPNPVSFVCGDCLAPYDPTEPQVTFTDRLHAARGYDPATAPIPY